MSKSELPGQSENGNLLPNGERNYSIGQVFPLFTKEAISEYRHGERRVVLSGISLDTGNLPVFPFTFIAYPEYHDDEESIAPFVQRTKTINGKEYSEFYPLHLQAGCDKYVLEELGLNSKEEYKFNNWYYTQDNVVRFFDRLRFQTIFPSGEIYESCATLGSTTHGYLAFNTFYPEQQPATTQDWIKFYNLRYTRILHKELGKPLALTDEDSQLTSVKGRFVLADEDPTTTNFRIKKHLIHVQSSAKSAFNFYTHESFDFDKRLIDDELGQWLYWAANNVPFEDFIGKLNNGFKSSRIKAVARRENPLPRTTLVGSISSIITDGKCSTLEDFRKGILVEIEGGSYYAKLKAPNEYDLERNPFVSDLVLSTPFSKKELVDRLKAVGLSLPTDITWQFM